MLGNTIFQSAQTTGILRDGATHGSGSYGARVRRIDQSILPDFLIEFGNHHTDLDNSH
ncbi:hypothetical protein SDC9_166390 [bioreactor metagenome]|uniref:Uncharacterized protein n=1 Tax=bioreactor metagenome TaxID=1076179 RepID=A0A645G4F5_9ZZZZ